MGGLLFGNEEIRKIKCGADKRRRRGLDRAEHLFSPPAKMQTNLLKSMPCKQKDHPMGGLLFGNEEIRKIKCGADERRRRGLDRAEHLFSPSAKMQTNLLKSMPCKQKDHPLGGLLFLIV